MKSRHPGRSRAARLLLRPHKTGDGIAGPLVNGSLARRLRFEPLEDRRLLAIVTVDTIADTIDFNDGRTSLREAIFATNTVPGTDEIHFDPALFAAGPVKILLKQGGLKITDALTISGPGRDLLSIDGGASGSGDGVQALQIELRNSNSASHEVSLARLTFANGQALNGGAIGADGYTVLNIDDSRFVNNHATRSGGAIYTDSGRLNVLNTAFVENQSLTNGGAISGVRWLYVGGSEFTHNASAVGGAIGTTFNADALTIVGSQFIENVASSSGGAIACSSRLLSAMSNSGFLRNSAKFGGAVSVQDGRLMMESCVIDANTAQGSGGGIYFSASSNQDYRSPSLIVGSTFANNVAVTSGGAMVTSGATEIQSSTIAANSAGLFGGGVYHDRGTFSQLLVTRSTISKNSANSGGGVFSRYRTTIESCTISDNTAIQSPAGGGNGGGLYFSENSFLPNVIRASIVSGNASQAAGGGVYSSTNPLDVIDCAFTENYAGGGARLRPNGGALYATSKLRVNSTLFDGNEAAQSGGAIYATMVAFINDSTFSGNRSQYSGGGIYVRAAAIRNCVIVDNKAVDPKNVAGNGGGVFSSALTENQIESCLIAHNVASGSGGGLFSGSRPVVITNSTISGNLAAQGGGIQGKPVTLRHSTVVANYTTGGTQQAGVGGVLSQSLILIHSIVAGNKDELGAAADVGFIAEAHHSLIGDNRGSNISTEAPIGAPDANGNLIGGPIHGVIDPLLAPLADNGGPTLSSGAHMLTHALLPGSPAINAGDPAFVPGVAGAPEFDQRGAPFTRLAGPRIDIGAFEAQSPAGALAADFDFSGHTDGLDFLTWQRNFGKPAAATFREGDATADGDVDSADFAVWAARFGGDETAPLLVDSALSLTGMPNIAAATATRSAPPRRTDWRVGATASAPLVLGRPADYVPALRCSRHDPAAVDAALDAGGEADERAFAGLEPVTKLPGTVPLWRSLRS